MENGAELRLGTELLDFQEHSHGVIARLRDRNDGREYEVWADYVIAAYGADSPIRESLGIKRSGVGQHRFIRSVLFRCPDADVYLAQGAQQFSIEQDDFTAFLTAYGDSRWVSMFEGHEDRTQKELAAAIGRSL